MEELVGLTIDGQEVQVPKGTTVLQAAKGLGIEIPHLCFLEGLAPGGACRLCVVELDGGRLVPACTRGVREGMEVKTSSPKVLEARRFVLELLWSIHLGDCATCEKAGACALQQYTYELGADKRRFPVSLPEEPPWDRESPLIERDLRLCVLCGRCIAACRELSQGILDYMRRGMLTLVTTPFNKRLDEAGCDFCGSCIAVCPVGCLVERDRKFRGREWELTPTRTTCSLCSAGCELVLDLGKGEPVRARPGEDGFLCARGKFGWDFSTSEERLTAPLIRDGDGFREASWDEALSLIAERLSGIGEEAVAGIAHAGLPSEALYAFGKLFRDGLGTGNLAAWGVEIPAPIALALPGRLAPVRALEEAKAILAVGPALGEAFPRARVAVKRALKAGAKLVVLDPVDSELARLATVQLAPEPGREVELIAALAESLTEGTGTPEELGEAVEILKPGFALLTTPGFLGPTVPLWRGGAARQLVVVSPQANWWGALVAGLHPGLLPGPKARPGAPEAWQGPLSLLSGDSGVRGLLLVGVDPLGEGFSLPELEFLVVQDLFLTETAKSADVVLPLRGFLAEEGSLFLPERRALCPVVGSPVPPTWQVMARLAQALGASGEVASLDELARELEGLMVKEPQAVPEPSARESAEGDRWALPVYPRFALPSPAATARSDLVPLTPGWSAIGLPPADAEESGLSPGTAVEVKLPERKLTGRVWLWEALPKGAVAVPSPSGPGPGIPTELKRAEEVA